MATRAVTKKRRKAVKKRCRYKTVVRNGRRKKIRVCKPVRRKTPVRRPSVPQVTYTPSPTAYPPAVPLDPPPGPTIEPQPQPGSDPGTGGDPQPSTGADPNSQQPQFDPGPVEFGPREAERLLWRAGFGPRAGDVQRLVDLGLDGAVRSLVYPQGAPQFSGPAPHDEDGNALAPYDLWGHDHVWWLDRMVRSSHQLVERMTLVWHDWFATSKASVQTNLMLQQNELLRSRALGSFADLLRDITINPAMLDWLDGIRNTRWDPNENYGREVMELFTLGANRGAYTEQDIREAARALTGWRADWDENVGLVNFRFDPNRHDAGTKTVFGQTGNWGWADVVRLCLENPLHRSFFVRKLWSHFVAGEPNATTLAALEELYVSSGHQVAPVLEAILKHPQFYRGGTLVKPPVVFLAGVLRALGRPIDTDAWWWYCSNAGQALFQPPNVAGWDDSRWLDTSTWRGRWDMTAAALSPSRIDAWNSNYDASESPALAVERALAHVGNPTLTTETRAALESYAASCIPANTPNWNAGPYRGYRQNALRMLILTSSDHQTC